MIHRDLKPSNVLLTDGSNGRFLKIGDIGFSVCKEASMSSNTIGRRTNKYVPFEVTERHSNRRYYNEKADVFSLAVMALEVFGFVINKPKDRYIDV